MKSSRNKTIDLTVREGKHYKERCITLNKHTPLPDLLDKTILGDTFEMIKFLPKKFVDLMIVDPPYNLAKNFHGNKFGKMKDEDYAHYTEQWLTAILPLLKDTASIYVCCDWQSSSIIAMTLKKYLCLQNRITWQREKGRGAKHNWKNAMEDIWFATKSNSFVFHTEDVKMRRKVLAPYRTNGEPKDWEETKNGNFRNTYASNFWDDISVPYWSMSENTDHPTQKPEKLLAKLILASSDKGDIVFDPFLGSGSTSVTAKKLGRHYVGIEQNEQYCVWAEKRLENAEIDKSIQGYVDGVFWERNTRELQKNLANYKKHKQ